MIQTRFSASRISELLSGGQGKTAQTYILDLALQSIGIKDEMTTPAMKHGISNQLNAFQNVVKPLYPTAEWHDEFILINEHCGASPDILDNSTPIDVKCPFFIDSYLEQINSVPKKYYQQVQMQMMACKSDVGRLVFYLTKPEEWGVEEVSEYPFPLELRFKVFEFSKDEELQETILAKVEESEPKKIQIIKLLTEAEIMDYEQFFYVQMGGFSYRKLKDCNNILNLDKCIRVGNEFYYGKAVKDVPVIEAPKKDYPALIQKGKELKEKAKL